MGVQHEIKSGKVDWSQMSDRFYADLVLMRVCRELKARGVR